jgi:superfamily II DNA/RNA helicase
VPTRELANQAARTLQPLARTRGLRTVALYGGVPVNRHHELLKTQIDLVIATPGRLNDLLERGSISLSAVTMVVIDEADQMADMGFLPQVERILRQAPSGYQVLLFSATLDGEVDRLIRRYQQDPVFVAVEIEASQEEAMLHRFIAVQDEEKAAVAADIVAGPERSLLFTRTQRGADRAARLLSRLGVRCGVLHGGVSQSQRERVLHSFEDGSVPVMVATNVAARGLHIDGIETVIHYDVPEEDKVFIHRSGRTARAGATGLVVTLVQLEQLRDVDALRLRSGRREQIVGMSPGDERLRDLRTWDPPLDPERAEMPANPKQQRGAFAGAPRRWSRGPVRARSGAGARR